jgi:hypothetical protein
MGYMGYSEYSGRDDRSISQGDSAERVRTGASDKWHGRGTHIADCGTMTGDRSALCYWQCHLRDATHPFIRREYPLRRFRISIGCPYAQVESR